MFQGVDVSTYIATPLSECSLRKILMRTATSEHILLVITNVYYVDAIFVSIIIFLVAAFDGISTIASAIV